jgi:hypothetical protein
MAITEVKGGGMAVETKGGPGLKATRDAHALLQEAAAAGLVVDFRTGVIE